MVVETVAVIGAGVAGRAFALRCARAGFCVVLEDVMPEKLRRAQDEYGEAGSREQEAGSREQEIGSRKDGGAVGSLRFASTVEEAVHSADLAIDFVPDELESKLEIFSLLDRMAPPRTILCTPTLLSITDLASCTYRGERCVGLRGVPGEVSLMRSRFLDAEVEAAVVAFLGRLGSECLVVDDVEEPMLVKNVAAGLRV